MPSAVNTYDEALSTTLKNEGGVDKNSVLGSGVSNFGVTQRAWDAYAKSKGIPTKPVTQLRPSEVTTFYREEYYDKPKLGLLPPEIAKQVFDFGVNAGPSVAIKKLQEVIGAVPDGLIGNETTQKVVSSDESKTINSYLDSRLSFYESLAKEKPQHYAKFLDGWRARVDTQRQGVRKNAR